MVTQEERRQVLGYVLLVAAGAMALLAAMITASLATAP